MSTTKKANELTIFIAIIIACVFMLLVSSFIRLLQTQVDAEQYENAAFCQNGETCRTEARVVVAGSLTRKLDEIRSGKYSVGRSAKITSYRINVKLSNGETHTIKILPNLDLSAKEFNVKNIYSPFPHDVNEKMAETSFEQGSTVKIEMWHHKPTILYAEKVLGAPALPPGEEYALPTEENPLISDMLSHAELTDTSVALGIAILFLVALQLFLKQKTVRLFGRHHDDTD